MTLLIHIHKVMLPHTVVATLAVDQLGVRTPLLDRFTMSDNMLAYFLKAWDRGR